MPPVKLGVIGCGVIGSKHIEAAAGAKQVDLVAVADLRRELAEESASRFGVIKAYSDAQELLADPEVEAVVLAMPAFMRTSLALKAFAAGKHVLTEKPVAMSSGEVRRMLAAQGDLVAACASSRIRFLAGTDATTEFIATGALGNLRVVRCRAIGQAGLPPESTPPAWRLSRSLNGGGILVNWGCYDLDYLLGITGWRLQPETVLAQTWTTPAVYADYVAPGSDAETHVTALIRCAGGTVITYERAELAAAKQEMTWEIIGDRGSLVLEMMPSEEKETIFIRADAKLGAVQETIWNGSDSWTAGHIGPVTDFVNAIQTGETPKTDLHRALIIQEITDAVYRSAEIGEAVQLAR